ncbi:MAG: hypothetical protein K6G50_04745 [bacterium]|nr:hypothetical protein [bacterium]
MQNICETQIGTCLHLRMPFRQYGTAAGMGGRYLLTAAGRLKLSACEAMPKQASAEKMKQEPALILTRKNENSNIFQNIAWPGSRLARDAG